MLNCSASLAMSTSVLKALPGKLDFKDTHLVFSIIVEESKLIRTGYTLRVKVRNTSYQKIFMDCFKNECICGQRQ